MKRVQLWLQDNFTYSEHVPSHDVPLMGFLQEDKRGYCQQFSGTMALMLRMAGIPAQVAAGFSPGSYNKDTREYRVRDLDAHSWVEVWFTGIGWVPFDPTPARSPAGSQSSALATSAAAADAGEVRIRQGAAVGEHTAQASAAGGEGGNWVVLALVLLLVVAPLGAAAVAIGSRITRMRLLSTDELAGVQLSELRRALVRLGWNLPESTTLLALERRLGRLAGPSSEAYAGALRAQPLRPARSRRPEPTAAAPAAPRAQQGECARPAQGPDRDPARRSARVGPSSSLAEIYRNLRSRLYSSRYDHHAPAVQHPVRSRRRPDRAGDRHGPDRDQRDRHG